MASLLDALRWAGAHEQAAALLARYLAAHAGLDDPQGVARLLDSFLRAGRARDIYATGWRPPVPPGPTRDELAALAAAAASSCSNPAQDAALPSGSSGPAMTRPPAAPRSPRLPPPHDSRTATAAQTGDGSSRLSTCNRR